MNFEEYSHELSNAFYFPESFPTEAASNLYDNELEGCNCISECTKENECKCIQRSGTYYEYKNPSEVKSYTIRYLNEDIPSYECNDNCKCCGVLCGNRLIQIGPRKDLIVKQCENASKGVGLFTNKEVENGNFICQYAGEITTEEEATQRYTIYQSNEVNYIFCIKENFGGRVLKTFIDPTIYGNIGRYINHSCDANCNLYIFRINNTMPVLGVFANQDIPLNTEITYDYGSETGFAEIIARKKCYCMSNNCRKHLPCDISLIS